MRCNHVRSAEDVEQNRAVQFSIVMNAFATATAADADIAAELAFDFFRSRWIGGGRSFLFANNVRFPFAVTSCQSKKELIQLIFGGSLCLFLQRSSSGGKASNHREAHSNRYSLSGSNRSFVSLLELILATTTLIVCLAWYRRPEE